MPNPDDIQAQLAAQRATLAQLLAQPDGNDATIAEVRAEIAQLRAELRGQGVAVDEHPDDIAPAQGRVDVKGRVVGTAVDVKSGTINVTHTGDQVGGDKVIGDKVMGDKIIYNNFPQPRPVIDLDTANGLFASLPLDAIPDPSPLPSSSRMVLRHNPLFVGREDDLRALAATLKSGSAAAITTGIGGVGKTQLASEFVYCYGQFFAGGVFWLSFADPAGIEGEIAACGGAGALELYTDAAGLSQAEQVARVLAAWAEDLPRLLIFDNCDDQADVTGEALLAKWLPRSGGCRVLVTSRRDEWRGDLNITAHHLDTLPRAESIVLLRSYRGDLGDAEADEIADVLGDLPLALTLAGSYLARYKHDAFGKPATYLVNLKKQLLDHRSLDKGDLLLPTKREGGVRAAFMMSFQRLDASAQVDALAIAALARASYLAPGEPFPRGLLLATLGETTDDEEIALQRADALRRLVALGLLERAGEGALRIHRLVSVFAREVIEDDEVAQGAVEWVVSRAASSVNNQGYPGEMQSILAHLRYVTEIAEARADTQAATLCSSLGYHLNEIGDYTGAREVMERALAINEQVLGAQHLDTALSLNNLGSLLQAQGDLAGARPYLERALAIREQMLGAQHLDTALSLNNLGGLLQAQGDLAGARPYLERTLAIYEEMLGVQHIDTARSLNNLGYLLQAQGDLAGARMLYKQALAIREQVLGQKHPDTASSLNNLGYLLQAQGDLAGARTLYERALVINEQVLGAQHPNTATSLNNLGYLLRARGDLMGARPYYERALAIREQVLGQQHPDTASSLNNLGYLLQVQGDLAGARPLFERALEITEQALGPMHPNTQAIRRNLAVLNAPLQTREQRIADIAAQAESAVVAAFADPAGDRTVLTAQLETVAQQIEQSMTKDSPYLALAAHLRTLAAQLTASTADEAAS